MSEEEEEENEDDPMDNIENEQKDELIKGVEESLQDEEQKKNAGMALLAQIREQRARRRERARLIEQEAELGSDNEENDHVRKQIRNSDSEENDDDLELDKDLEELINNEKENGDEENAMHKFMQDLKQQEKEALKQAFKMATGEGKKQRESDSLAQERQKFLKLTEEQRQRQLERD